MVKTVLKALRKCLIKRLRIKVLGRKSEKTRLPLTVLLLCASTNWFYEEFDIKIIHEMGFFKKLFKIIGYSIAVFVGILFGPNPIPNSVKFTEFDVPPLKNLGRGFSSNDLLDNAERLFEDEIKGPEAFEIINGELYTSLHGGYVAKVFDDQVIPVVKFGEPCVGWYEESKCGRPLGIKAYGSDYLLVADAYYGIHKYNIHTKKSENIVDKNIIIDGKPAKIFNSVEVGRDGSIYWTHSSSDFTIQDGIYTFLADGSGRLLKYDPVTKQNVVLLKDMYFPNGVVLSPREDYLLVAETGQSRVLKFHLTGPKKHTTEVFIDGLPGVPDNLRRNGDDRYFIPLVLTSSEKNPILFQVISKFPILRKFSARVLSLIDHTLMELDDIIPNYYTKRAIHFVGHLESVAMFLNSNTIVLDVDSNGNVVGSYQGTDGSVTSVSDVIPHNGYLYLGSPTNNYLARVKLSKLGIRPNISPSAPYIQAAPPPPTTTTTPRPTTTTPRPTTTTPRPTTTTPRPTTTTPRPTTTTSRPTPAPTTSPPPPPTPQPRTTKPNPPSPPPSNR